MYACMYVGVRAALQVRPHADKMEKPVRRLVLLTAQFIFGNIWMCICLYDKV